jgi:hypothetical protein
MSRASRLLGALSSWDPVNSTNAAPKCAARVSPICAGEGVLVLNRRLRGDIRCPVRATDVGPGGVSRWRP